MWFMIQNRDLLREFMKDNVEIDEYISIMLLDSEFCGFAKLVAFSKLNLVQIQVFDSLESAESISRILTVKGKIW